jgi:hypothetical protein
MIIIACIVILSVLGIKYFHIPFVARFKHGEHFQFFFEAMAAITATGAVSLKIVKEFTVFQACFNDEDEAFDFNFSTYKYI